MKDVSNKSLILKYRYNIVFNWVTRQNVSDKISVKNIFVKNISAKNISILIIIIIYYKFKIKCSHNYALVKENKIFYPSPYILTGSPEIYFSIFFKNYD
jgi:hypothetical protein